jgi:hypothetical protein
MIHSDTHPSSFIQAYANLVLFFFSDDYIPGSLLQNKIAASTSAANVPMPPTNNAFLFPLSLHHPSQNSLVPMEGWSINTSFVPLDVVHQYIICFILNCAVQVFYSSVCNCRVSMAFTL